MDASPNIVDTGRMFYRATAVERIVQGAPYCEAVLAELSHYDCARAHVVTGRSLRASPLFAALEQALGHRLAGVSSGVGAHTSRGDVLRVAAEVRSSEADILIAFGGGSVIDAVKMTQLCLWNDIVDPDGFDDFIPAARADPSLRPTPELHAPRSIAIPTTFSAAEFNWYAGCTDTRRATKHGFSHPYFVPRSIILDPRATMATPLELLLSTGVKAVDHAVERMCSVSRNAFSDALSEKALALLATALPAVARDKSDRAALADAQIGMWLSTSGATTGVTTGASHGVGHQLGAYCGVPHGLTSCVLLPAVLRWNEELNVDRQRDVARAMAFDGTASQAVHQFVARLGLPTRLRDVGVTRAQLAGLAERALRDHSTAHNPRPISSARQVMEILELAW